MAHVLEESHWTTRRDRLLRGPDRNVLPLVRPGNAGPRSSTHRDHCGYGPSNGSLDRSTAARGIPWGEVPRYLIRDRDHAFDGLGPTAEAMGIYEVLTAPPAPW